MIGEKLLGVASPGSPLEFNLPAGTQMVGLRTSWPCRIWLHLDGREAARASPVTIADDGDMPGSGWALMIDVQGQKKALVLVSAETEVWVVME